MAFSTRGEARYEWAGKGWRGGKGRRGGTQPDPGSRIPDPGVRRPRSTGDDAYRRVRALRLLPADVSDLRVVERGNGHAAWPRLPDESGPRGARGDDADLRR